LGAHRSSVEIDLVGWAGDETGELSPQIVVEVLSGRSPRVRDAALARLAFARDILGAPAHCVFDGQEWFRADAGLVDLQPIPAPPPALPAQSIGDAAIAARLLGDC